MNTPDTTPPAPGGTRHRADETSALDESLGPPLRDPRSRSAIDNIGVDDQADLLDAELDDQPGDDAGGAAFLDDVRSDDGDDERNERR